MVMFGFYVSLNDSAVCTTIQFILTLHQYTDCVGSVGQSMNTGFILLLELTLTWLVLYQFDDNFFSK